MYNSGYSQVSKNSPMAQKRMQYRSKDKSCGYYMRIVFFFSSLIQSLIIVSLVLFLVYGKKQDSASTGRIKDLEESFSRLSIENVALKQQRKNLTNLLNVTLTQKARNDWDLTKFRHYSNISSTIIQDYDRKLQQCTTNLFICNGSPRFPCDCAQRLSVPENCNCGMLLERLKARLELVDSNFTQTVQKIRIEMDQTAKERDYINLEVIRLRREKSTQEKELQFQKKTCKDDFFHSLSGVSNVSKAFLEKIDSLFPTHLAFQITCEKQREHLEQIRTNCTSLSREMENKFQVYLNSVGDRVSDIQAENSRLKAENWRLSEDYRWCTQNRTGLIKEHKENLGKLQQKHDQDKERLLMDKMKLNGEIQVLENSVKYKNKEVDHLTQQINYLNMSCMSKTGLGGYGGVSNSRTSGSSQSGWSLLSGVGSSSAGGGQLGRTGSGGLGSSLGSSGSALNKLGSTGLGSSSSSFSLPGSSSSLGSTGLGSNKFGSTRLGSTSSSFSSPGSSSSLGSTGLGLNKLGSTGLGSSSSSFSSPGSSSSLGSTGLGLNKLGSTGLGSSSSSFASPGSSTNIGSTGSGLDKQGSTEGVLSSFGSSLGLNKPVLNAKGSLPTGSSSSGSTGSSPNFSLSGIGSNKPTSNMKSSSGLGSSSGSTGSTSKTESTSSGFSWFGFGTSNSGQSKTGSGTGRGTSSGSNNGGTSSAFGAGKISGLGGGSVNVAQHLHNLQLLINPPGPEEKQDHPRMYG